MLKDIIIGFTVFIFSIVSGYFLIPQLRKLQLGQTVRDDGPKSHYIKSGTPTFGGFIFIIPVFSALLIFYYFNIVSLNIMIIFLFSLSAFSLIGFADDYIKVRINKEGLSVKLKTVLQAVGIIILISLLFTMHDNLFLYIPFLKIKIIINSYYKIAYGIFLFFYFYFCINAVNLTDGVDGLLSSVSIVVAGCYIISLHILRNFMPEHHFAINSLLSLMKILIPSLIGYLFFNKYPARCFMGDTGSLMLGSWLSLIPVFLGVPWLIFFYGIIYMMEAFSVIIQVGYFKYTGGKRIFRMSPIHHHFELGGWKENKIVLVFSAITLISALSACLWYYFILGI